MKQQIRYKGVQNMFGYGNPEKGVFATYFPAKMPASKVADFLLSRSDLVTSVEHVLPSNLLDYEPGHGKEQAIKATMHPYIPGNGSVLSHAIAEQIELQFNPAAWPWRANYAGALKADPESRLYVVTEGETEHLHEFLDSTDGLRLNVLEEVDGLNFATTTARAIELAEVLPHNYFDFITSVVRTTLDYEPRI